MLKEELEKILAGNDLTAEETGAALEKMASGKVPPVQIGAFLGALRAKANRKPNWPEPPGCSGENAVSSTTAHGK